MRVTLTGATGFIGSHILTDLQDHGHSVTALVRDAAQAETVSARGATATVVDLYDRAALVDILREGDAAIHTASPGDATSADLDGAVADAAREAVFAALKQYEVTMHFNGQSTVSLDGERASGETYCIAHHVFSEDGVRKIMLAYLRYLDSFVKQGERWRFAERNLYLEFSDVRPLGA